MQQSIRHEAEAPDHELVLVYRGKYISKGEFYCIDCDRFVT
jgi:hypothetical protein